MTSSIYEDGAYAAQNPTWHAEDSAWKCRQILRLLERNRLAPKTVCEVGCGAGQILVELAGRLAPRSRLTGYEISPQAYELCRGKTRKNIDFRLADLLAEDVVFDLVLAIDVVEHVEDYLGFLRRLRARGRHQIFHLPLDLSVQTVLRSAPILAARRNWGHLHYFTKETALASLRDTGYEIVDWLYTPSQLELPNRSWKAKLLHFPRKAAFASSPDLAARLLGGFSLLVLTR